jgi:hypothetical protein
VSRRAPSCAGRHSLSGRVVADIQRRPPTPTRPPTGGSSTAQPLGACDARAWNAVADLRILRRGLRKRHSGAAWSRHQCPPGARGGLGPRSRTSGASRCRTRASGLWESLATPPRDCRYGVSRAAAAPTRRTRQPRTDTVVEPPRLSRRLGWVVSDFVIRGCEPAKAASPRSVGAVSFRLLEFQGRRSPSAECSRGVLSQPMYSTS